MRFTSAVAVSTFAGLVAATNHTVKVGIDGLKFSPSNITADPMDFVTFVFTVKNHTITQSSFADPCTPLSGGFDSGYVASNDTTTSYTIQVTTAKPVWAFCSQASVATGNHCHKGMVFSINPDAGKNAKAGNATSAEDFLFNAQVLGANDPPIPAAVASGSAAPAPTGSAGGAAPTGDAGASGAASASGSVQFPSGDNGSGAPAPTGSASSSASGTGDVANAGAAATSAGDNVSGSSTAATPTGSTKSGAQSLTRSSAGVLGAVGLVVALLL